MPTLILRPAGPNLPAHEENCGRLALPQWRGWRRLRARQRQRGALRDLADNPHLLRDLGLSREQALDEAGKPFWR